MGSGDWFRTIIIRKRSKEDRSKHTKEDSTTQETNGARRLDKESTSLANNSSRKSALNGVLSEDIAARRIQAFFRGYMARISLNGLKGIVRRQGALKLLATENQQSSALKLIHFWAKLQSEIKARRLSMVTEDRINQRKLENKLKLEAKLHDVEEWCGGSETMEEILRRIQTREEAAVKRERAMAYAFSHQWRANSSQYFGHAYYDLGKDSWGWSWKERWVAVRPWEIRVQSRPTNAKNIHSSNADKSSKSKNTAAMKLVLTVKRPLSNGNDLIEPRTLAEKPAAH